MEIDIFAPALFTHQDNNGTLVSLSEKEERTVGPCSEYIMTELEITALIVFGCIFVLGYFGNCLIINAILKYCRMKTATNLYLFNITIANQLVIFCIPLEIGWIIMGNWPFKTDVCKIYMGTMSTSLFANSLFLMLMNIDRYIVTCHHTFSRKYRTAYCLLVVCILCWLICTAISVPAFVYSKSVKDGCDEFCDFILPETGTMSGHSTFLLYTFILGFAIPLIVSFGFYSLLLPKGSNMQLQNEENTKIQNTLTKFVSRITLVYVICWLPYWLRQFILVYSPSSLNAMIAAILIFLTGILKVFHSAVNALVCFRSNKNFNSAFRMSFHLSNNDEMNIQLDIEDKYFHKCKNINSSKKDDLIVTASALECYNDYSVTFDNKNRKIYDAKNTKISSTV